MPKYIGPYKILEAKAEVSRYKLDLPLELKKRRIHPSFHKSKLKLFYRNDNKIFPKREAQIYYDFAKAEEHERLMDEILTHKWEGNNMEFLVQWNLGDTTWESYTQCKELEALDRYLELQGLEGDQWKQLSRRSSETLRAAKRMLPEETTMT